MLSFFAKKKHSPDTPTDDIIQGPQESNPVHNGDDFIFVERKEPGNGPGPGPSTAMYPPMPPAPFGLPYPGRNFYPGNNIGTSSMTATLPESISSMSYLQGVPFEVAPQISSKSNFEIVQMQVDGILALLTRQMSVDESNDYSFTLERSIQNEAS